MATKGKAVVKKNAKVTAKKSGKGAGNGNVASAITAQIDDLKAPALDRLVKIQTLLETLRNLNAAIGGQAAPNALVAKMSQDVDDIAISFSQGIRSIRKRSRVSTL